MVMRVRKTPEKGVEDLGEYPYGETMEPEEGKKRSKTEYPHAFRKVASYSGTARVMKCATGQCGNFDDIINIYVDPEGVQVEQYRGANNRTMNLKGNNDVDPENVKRKDFTFWGGKPKEVSAEYRKKKHSTPVKRIHAKVSNRNKNTGKITKSRK